MRVAVAGLGYFSRFHLAAWAADARVTLVGGADPASARRAWASDSFGLPVFAETAAMLAATEPDIVDIVAPPPTHRALIEAALRPGRVVICQKPFCTSPSEAAEMADRAEQTGTTLLVHENFRFQPWYRTLRARLEAGDLGAIYQARFALRPGDGRGPGAYLDRQPAFQTMPRLLIHETGVHFIDLFGWLFGPVTSVYADLRRLNPALAGEDAGVLLLDHASGVRSCFDGNRLADHATDNPRRTMGEMLVEGEGGTLRLDGQGRLWRRSFGSRDETPVPLIAPVDETSFGGGCVAALCAHVVDALQGRRPFENRARDYLPVMQATEAAYASASEGRKLALPEQVVSPGAAARPVRNRC